MQNINLTLKRLRKERNLTQLNLATKLGISLRAYSKIETGETSLNIERVSDIASVFDLTMSESLLNLFSEDILVSKLSTIEISRHYEEIIALLKQQYETLKEILISQN